MDSPSGQRSILSYFQRVSLKEDSIAPSAASVDCTKITGNNGSRLEKAKTPDRCTPVGLTMLTRKRKLRESSPPCHDCSMVSERSVGSDIEKGNDASFSLDCSISSDQTMSQSFCGEPQAEQFVHCTLDFLKPEKIRDAQLRRPSDKEYDRSTLYVPEKFIQAQTPAMKLWWRMKSSHFDTMLFFKVGKFYELYHMDAVEAVRELKISFMRGNTAHCGFPEMACQKFMDQLAKRNYKVARIEQTETVRAMSERITKLPKLTKEDRIVQREICEIVTPGTRHLATDGYDDGELDGYLFALSESQRCDGAIGFAACNVETGVLMLGSIPNDAIAVRTLFSRLPAKQILLINDSELRKLAENNGCFVELLHADKVVAAQAELDLTHLSLLLEDNALPDPLAKIFAFDGSQLTIRDSKDVALLEAFAVLLFYLRTCKIDDTILSRRNVAIYSEEFHVSFQKHMSLDAVTLQSLNVLRNADNVSLEASVDFCCTKPGKRLLRRWLLQPSCDLRLINERLDIVDAIAAKNHLFNDLRSRMKGLPDMERMLMKIHSMSSNGRRPDHPDLRAVMAGEEIISKGRLKTFVQAVNGLERAIDILQESSRHLSDLGPNLLTTPISSLLAEGLAEVIAVFKASSNEESLALTHLLRRV